MRVKLLRGKDVAGVLLVYPSTLSEYGEAIEAIDRRAAAGSAGPGSTDAAYVVTTSALRDRWGLPDLAASGRVPMVDAAEAFGLLAGGAGPAADPDEPLADPAETAGEPPDTETGGAPPETGRMLAAARARLEQMLGSLVGAGPPPRVRETLRDELHQAVASGERAVDDAAQRARTVLSLPWRSREPERFDPARVAQALDRTHGGLDRVKARLVDLLAACPEIRGPLTVEGPRRGGAETPAPALVVRPAPPGTVATVPCLAGPPGVGKTSLARLLAAALGRACASVVCNGLTHAALRGARSGRPGRIAEELRRVGVRNPVFVLDEIDRLDDAGAAAALVELLDPAPGATFRDHYLDLPLDLSGALFVATATNLDSVPATLRERMTVIELSGYTDAEKRVIAAGHLLPLALAFHRLTADDVRFTDAAVDTIVRGYARKAGVWGLAGALGAVCGKVVRRRAEGDEAPVEVSPAMVAGMLGAPEPAGARVAGRGERPGVAVGLCRSAAGGEVMCIEASRMPGSGALTLTGRQGEVMRESARTALSWLRANASRYGLDPAFHRDTDLHLHVQAGGRPNEGASAGVTMAAALVSALTGRPLRGDIAMTGEIGLCGQVLPVAGIKEKVLAAHRWGLTRVILPRQNRKQVDEDLGDELRRAVAVDYVTGIDELLKLALGRARAPEAAAQTATPPGRMS